MNDFRFCIRAEEVEANNEIATANLTGTPVCIRGSLSAGDSDYFAIVNDTENSQTFTFALFRPIGGVNTDTILSLYDLSGSLITEDDDLGEVNYSMISRALDVDSAYYV